MQNENRTSWWLRPTTPLVAAQILPALLHFGCAAPRTHPRAELEPMPKLECVGSFGPTDSSIRSVVRGEDGTEVPHGLSVTTERGRLREAAVYERGVLIRHYHFHPAGHPLVSSYKDAAGNGFVQVWNGAELAFTGDVRDGRRWHGEFLVIEVIPATFGRKQFMLHTYRAGELADRAPFPFERVGLDAPGDSIDPTQWPWRPLEWPVPQFATAPE